VTPPVRYRFESFVLSPRRRTLLRGGRPVALIPKYFDLLLLLVRHRQDAVSKQTIFADIWSDVVVSDGALSQAVRTLRRALGDNSREPRFIRTVSRHGYQFVWSDVTEEADDGANQVQEVHEVHPVDESDSLASLVDRLFTGIAAGSDRDDETRETAERLHAAGTVEAVALIRQRPDHGAALAIMRDARWSVPGAGAVPLDAAATLALVRLRIADARRTIGRRWAGAALAGAMGGVMSGVLGALALSVAAGAHTLPQTALGLAAIGAIAGGAGAGGVGAGLAAAEVLARSRRGLALAACGTIAGGLVAAVAHLVVRSVLAGLLGARDVHIPGFVDGLLVGGAVGIGYALATRQPSGGGIAAPTGKRRAVVALATGIAAAAAGMALGLAGRPLVGGLINEIARSSPNAQLVLAPLGQLIGEPDFGPVTRVILSALEGGAFGAAVAWGLTIRPKSRTSH
jgi:DNA-binding winged helix-turn-helix (wHTH) protein